MLSEQQRKHLEEKKNQNRMAKTKASNNSNNNSNTAKSSEELPIQNGEEKALPKASRTPSKSDNLEDFTPEAGLDVEEVKSFARLFKKVAEREGMDMLTRWVSPYTILFVGKKNI